MDYRTDMKKYFERLVNVSDTTHKIREQLIDKLVTKIEDLDIDFKKEKPSMVKNKIELLRLLTDLLDKHEKNIKETISVYQKQKELDNEQNESAIVVEFLKKMMDIQNE